MYHIRVEGPQEESHIAWAVGGRWRFWGMCRNLPVGQGHGRMASALAAEEVGGRLTQAAPWWGGLLSKSRVLDSPRGHWEATAGLRAGLGYTLWKGH